MPKDETALRRTSANQPLSRPGASVAALPRAPAAERQYRYPAPVNPEPHSTTSDDHKPQRGRRVFAIIANRMAELFLPWLIAVLGFPSASYESVLPWMMVGIPIGATTALVLGRRRSRG
jgi:hypothetical protein